MPLGAHKAAIMGTAGVATGDVVLLATNSDTTDIAAVDFDSGITSAYGEYIFRFYNVNPVTDAAALNFHGSTDGGDNYGVEKTTTFGPYANVDEANGSNTNFGYHTSKDVDGTDPQPLSYSLGNGADEHIAGEIHLFDPASTVYQKHFQGRTVEYLNINYAGQNYMAGYFNTTSAITAIKFAMSSGNMDGKFKMWGVK